MGTEVNQIPPGNDHLTVLELAALLPAAWYGEASLTAEHTAHANHLALCAECRVQLVMLRQATQTETELEQSPEFNHLLRLGEEAARSVMLSAQTSVSAPVPSVTRQNEQKTADSLGWRVWFNWRVLVPVATMLLAAFGGWWYWATQSPLRKANEAMQLAWRDRRPLESRISSFDYAPWIQTRGDNEGVTDPLARDRAERILLDTFAERPSAAAAHALGRFYLAEREFDKAIEKLEIALKSTPNDATLLNDLGAAHIEKGKVLAQSSDSGQNLIEYGKAYEHLNRAVEIEGNSLAVLFNHAQCLQLMFLPEQAIEAWHKYLKLDNSSAWAAEAKRNLQKLEEQQKKTSFTREQLFDNFMAGWRERDDEVMWQAISQKRNPLDGGFEERLVNAYLKASKTGDIKQAQNSWAALSKLGNLLFKRVNDRFTADMAAYYHRANEEQRELSLQGCLFMQSAASYHKENRSAEAIADYTKAQNLFLRAGNECGVLLSDWRLGYVYLFLPNIKLAESIFQRLNERAKVNSYSWMQFQSTMALAQIYVGRNEFSQAITTSLQAERLSVKLADMTASPRVLGQLIAEYFALKNFEGALPWLNRFFATEQMLASDITQKWQACAQTGSAMNSFRLHKAALVYHQEALRLAQLARTPLQQSRSLNFMGETYAQLADYDRAIQTLKQAIELGNALGKEGNGAEIIAYSALRLGDYFRLAKDYTNALSWYRQSRNYYEQKGYGQFLYATHKGELLTAYAMHDQAVIDRELPIVRQLFEDHREKIYQESQRNSFFDHEQSVYDIAIDIEYSRRQNLQRAFDISEESRARTLRDLFKSDAHSAPAQLIRVGNSGESFTSTPAMNLPQIKSELPPQVQLIQYAVLNDKLIIWLITQNQVQAKSVAVSFSELTKQVERFRTLIMTPAQETLQALQVLAKALYQQLIEPVVGELDQQKTICIVADKVLHDLPFQALFDAKSGKYLIESYALIYAPSASMFIASTAEARRRAQFHPEHVLAVGNPTFNPALQLQSLPASQLEAERIATLYRPKSQALTGRAASELAVTRELPQVEVAHFATHYLPSKSSVADSRFVLASQKYDNTDGELRNSEITRLRMPRTKLVILSACQTGAEQILGGEGAINAARPFLARQVPLVVASLWPVDSVATADLMILLHETRHLSGITTAESLRRAQCSFLRAADSQHSHPYYWAAFSLFGGFAAY